MGTDLRVAGIVFEGEKLLTTRMRKDGETYHVLPGGGVEEGESIDEALERELVEEVNIKVNSFRLAYIRELNIKDERRGVEFYFHVDKFEGVPSTGHDPEDKESELEEVCHINPGNLSRIEFHPEQLTELVKKDRENGFQEVKNLGLHDYP
jgi:8-oxo-dGTP diphosphatase